MVIVSCFMPRTVVSAKQIVDVEVVLSPKIDLVLTTGITGMDLKNFEKDVIAALQRQGIDTSNTDMVEISAIETTSSSLSSTGFDFATVVNSWKKIGSDTWTATADGQIYTKVPNSHNPPAWSGTAIINPDGFEVSDLKAEFTLSGGATAGQKSTLNQGFCFNVTQNPDGSLNGYFMSIANHNNTTRALFRFDHYTLNQAFDAGINNLMWCYNRNSWAPGARHANGADSFTSLASWTDTGINIKYEVTCKDGKIVIKDNGSIVANVTDNTYPHGTYGFWGNNCEAGGAAYMRDLKITETKTVSKDYAQVLLEPKWRKEAAHLVVNVEDPINKSLENPEALARTLADDIHFIQWGSNENKASAESFISKNDGNGVFANSSNYNDCVEKTAEYIKMIIDRMQRSNAQYVLIGENIDLKVTPESIKKGAVSDKFPTGRWLIHHDPSVFDNDEGQSPLTEVFQPDLLVAFDKPGRYDIMFDNEKVKEVYVHRKPVADFNIDIKDGNVNLTSTSYDLDSNEDKGFGKGIKSEQWFYKDTANGDWISGKLDKLTADKVYIIKLAVTDLQNTTSETIKYVGIGAPISNFNIANNLISTVDQLDIQDLSYDPQGYELTGYEWVIKKGSNVVGTYTTKELPNINFNASGFGVGDYSLSLKVTNVAGSTSGVFTQTFKVETARYYNKYSHVAIGFENGEGTSDDGSTMPLQTTYAWQTYGTSLVPASHALAIPNGYKLEAKYLLNNQQYDVNTAVSQPANIMEITLQYSPVVYSVDYDVDGGVLDGTNPSSYSVLYGHPLKYPTKEHYKFLGWYDQNNRKIDDLNPTPIKSFSNTADFYSKLASRVSGDLHLTARWELITYQVTTSKQGNGTITPTTKVGENGNLTVTWEPEEGYFVESVIVDGEGRDDLLNDGQGNSIDFTNINEEHDVSVKFTKIDEDKPNGGGSGTSKEYFTIKVEQRNGSNKATISKSKSVVKGDDYFVEWKPGEDDEIESILIDGFSYPVDKRNVSFKQIASNHEVIVTYKQRRDVDPMSPTDGYYTISVVSQNGDPKRIDTSVSKSAVLKLHENYEASWNAQNGYEVKEVWIDRNTIFERKLSASEVASGKYTLSDVSANHIIEVIFNKKGGTIGGGTTGGDKPEPEDKQVYVKTELVGGPGSITESAIIKEGESYTVEWDAIIKTSNDVEAPDYAVYKVSEVLVDGTNITTDKNSIELKNITQDQTVLVKMEPVLHLVETEIVGGGHIDPTVTLFDGQNYHVAAFPEPGWILKTVIVDGNVEYTKPETQLISETKKDDSNSLEDINQDDENSTELNELNTPVSNDETDSNLQQLSDQNSTGDNLVVLNDDNDTNIINDSDDVTNDLSANKETNVDNEVVYDTDDVPTVLFVARGELVIDINDREANPVNVKVNGITQNHKVRVEFVKEEGNPDGGETGGEPGGDDTPNYFTVTGRVTGGPGVFYGGGSYTQGSQKELSWTIPEGYEVEDVIVKVNDVQNDDITVSGNKLELNDIQDNYDVTVVLKKRGGGSNITSPDQPIFEKYSVTTAIHNGVGEITQSKNNLFGGSDWSVKWKIDESKFVIKEVRIDGITDDAYLNKSQIDFHKLSANHSVEVFLVSKTSPDNPNINKKAQYLVTTERNIGGIISASAQVDKGDDYKVCWEALDGYKVVSVTVDGNRRDDLIDKNEIEFKNIGQDHNVKVQFAKEDGSVINPDDTVHITTKTKGGKGFVTGNFDAIKGETVTIKWQADEGYFVSKVLVNGKQVSITDGELVIENIAEDLEVEVIFGRKASSGSGNNQEPVVNTSVKSHHNPYFTVTLLSLALLSLAKKRSVK